MLRLIFYPAFITVGNTEHSSMKDSNSKTYKISVGENIVACKNWKVRQLSCLPVLQATMFLLSYISLDCVLPLRNRYRHHLQCGPRKDQYLVYL